MGNLNPNNHNKVVFPFSINLNLEEEYEEAAICNLISRIKTLIENPMNAILNKHDNDARIKKLSDVLLVCFNTDEAKFIE